MMGFNAKCVEKKLESLPIFLKYVGPSLVERGNSDSWYENRYLFAIYTDLSFVKRFDSLLREVNGVVDLSKIFVDLKGNDKDYDLRVFDLFAEIWSVIWANKNGYKDIDKIPRALYSTPDFKMNHESGKKIVMEVKHIRSGGPFYDLARDRALGLLLVNGLIDKIGLRIEETEKYLKYQHKILTIENIYYRLAGILRNQLSNDEMLKLSDGSIKAIYLLNNLLKVKATKDYVGGSVVIRTHSQHRPEPLQTLNRLIREVNLKTEQLNSYIGPADTDRSKKFDEGIIFITGISNDEQYWDLLSYELNESNSKIWAEVNRVYTNESRIPIRIITDFGTKHGNYHDFPRNYKEYSEIRNKNEGILKNSSRYWNGC